MDDYIYAVARVRSREVNLLRRADLEQLMACGTEEECLEILRDKGWDGPLSSDALLAEEDRKTWTFLRELTEDFLPFFPLMLPVDANNLKAAIKCTALQRKPAGVFLSGGTLDPALLLESAENRDFSALLSPWNQAAEAAQRVFLQTGDGQLCDILLDRVCLEEMLRLGKACGLAVLERYSEWMAATADCNIAYRSYRAGKNREFLQAALVPCATLDAAAMADAAMEGPASLKDFLAPTPYAEAASLMAKSASAFEKWRDDGALEILQSEKQEYFTAGPLFAYAVARQREISSVRILLSGKRNGLEEQRIRERLRELYV